MTETTIEADDTICEQECDHPRSALQWEDEVTSNDAVLIVVGVCGECGVAVELVFHQTGIRLKDGSAGEYIHTS
jgi:hypothetical protein